MTTGTVSHTTGTTTTWVPKKKTDYLTTTGPGDRPWRADYNKPMTVREAKAIAYDMHKYDTDKSGKAYHFHLAAVEKGVVVLGGSTEERIAALFHDAVEDGHTTLTHLSDLGCTDDTIEMIDAVSKKYGEEQGLYLARIKGAGTGACRVKVADLLHNTRHDRMAAVPEHTRNRLLKKYRPALAALLLHLELLADEDTQAKLATKPIGTATTWSGSSGSTSYGSLLVKALIVGDWPVMYDAPILEADHGDGMSTFTLANGEIRTEAWKNGVADRRLSNRAYTTWTQTTPYNVSKSDRDDYWDMVDEVKDAATKKTTTHHYNDEGDLLWSGM